MPLPTGDLLNVRVGGTMGPDVWSIGFWFALTGQSSVPTPTQMNTAANALLGGFNNLVWGVATNALKAKNSAGVTLDRSSAYFYRNTALLGTGTATISPVGGTTGTPSPFYTARVVSLLTNSPGRTKRGRVYLPWVAGAITPATGLWGSDAGVLTNIATLSSTSTGFQSTGYFFGGSEVADWVVVSRTAATAASVTSLRMDNKPDTQRGRENKLTPTLTDTAAIS